MYSTQKRFVGGSNRQSANNGRQQVVYDDDIFGDDAVSANDAIENKVVEKKSVELPLNRRVDKPVAHVGPMLSKRFGRAQPFHPYQRPNRNVPPANGFQANGAHVNAIDNEYRLMKKIGHGTYGEVFKGVLIKTNQPVAIKRLLCKIKSEQQWQTVSREIDALRLLKQCKNVVQLLDVRKLRTSLQQQQHQLSLVFEFCPFEMQRIISNRRIQFTLPDIKALLFQLFEGLTFIHHKKILHRDIKTENLLLTGEGQLKIADFGLSREIIENLDKRLYTVNVVTLWYRSPELLFGDTAYTTAVDLWSAGCMMAEFWTRSPIMQGNSEREQIEMISRMCGAINTTVWPDVAKLQLFRTIRLKSGHQSKTLQFLFERSKSDDGSDLFKRLLTLDPKRRITAFVAQNHDFFWTEPLPSDLKDFMAKVRINSCEM